MSENIYNSTNQQIEVEYRCDGKCPTANIQVNFFNSARCCSGCASARKLFSELHPEFKGLWTEKYGYFGGHGCKLDRKDYPEECKQFDCRRKIYFIVLDWCGNDGRQVGKACIDAKYRKEIQPFWEALFDKIKELDGVKNGD